MFDNSEDKRVPSDDRLEAVIAKYLRDVESGDPPDRDALLAQHADLAADLREFFLQHDRTRQLLDPLRHEESRILCIRCPLCHRLLELTHDATLTSIHCSSCGSDFNLVGLPDASHPPGTRQIGQFQLLEQVGIGQFGTVWKARDLALDRTVAVKLPRRGQLSVTEMEMFVRDARVSAQLRHPHIVSVHEVGKHGDSIYIVSDFIEGATLKQWLANRSLPHDEAAKLCGLIAHALHYAHEAGVVHRDLKPGNIMIDRRGEPHIVDFGLAKRDDGEITRTLEGQILGTPAYMSPEQARGNAHRVDRTADIYSLGTILFEMLTGELPFRGDKQTLLAQIVRDEPPHPRKLNNKVPRDLETICLKCLEKHPPRRYPSAQMLAEDLRRFLNGVPVVARPVSRSARGWRWCRRNPLVSDLLAAVGLLLVGIAVVATAGYLRTRSALIISNERADTIERNLYCSEMRQAGLSAEDPNGLQVVNSLLEKWRPGTSVDRRGWEWYYLQSLLHQDVVTLNGHAGGVFSVAWSPDGTRLASGSGDRTIKIWSSNGKVMRTLTGHHGQVNSVHWHPDSTRLASASYDGTVRIWDCSSGETTATLQHDGPVDTAQWSGDGRWLATANRHEPGFNSPSQVSIWSTTTWMKETQFEAASDRSDSLDWNPKDSRIAVSSHDGKVRIWEWPSPKQVHDLDGVGSVAWNHDGTRLAAGFQRGANVWDIAQSRPVTAFESGSYVAGVAWSPGGSHIAYSRHLGVTVVNVKSGAEVRQLRGHLLRVTCVDWHPHDHRIATGDVYGRIKIWNTVDQASFTPGSTVISWNSNGSRYASRIGSHVVICDRQSSQVSRWLRGHPSDVITVAWSPDDAHIASTSYDGELWIWDATTGQVVHVLKTQLSYLGAMARLPGLLAWSSDGTRLANAEDDYVVRIIDARTAEIVRDLPRDAKRLSEIAWSPDNSRIASGGEDTVIRIWNTDTGRRTNVLGSSDHEEIRVICWNPNGSRIACATADNTISLWDVATGQRPHRLVGHVNYVHTVSWSPDGRRIASGDQAGKIRIWDAVTGHETLTLTYPSAVSKVAWNPDGKCLAAVGFGEENVRHWVLSEKSSGPGYW